MSCAGLCAIHSVQFERDFVVCDSYIACERMGFVLYTNDDGNNSSDLLTPRLKTVATGHPVTAPNCRGSNTCKRQTVFDSPLQAQGDDKGSTFFGQNDDV